MKIGQKTTTPSQEICYFFFAFMMLFILLVIDTAFRPIVHFFLPPELGVLKRPSENIEERPSYGQCSRNIKIQTTRNKP